MAQPLGRRNTMMIGFTGYIIFGLSVGLAYEKVSVSIPLFIFLFGMMTSFGNLGPGNMLGLTYIPGDRWCLLPLIRAQSSYRKNCDHNTLPLSAQFIKNFKSKSERKHLRCHGGRRKNSTPRDNNSKM